MRASLVSLESRSNLCIVTPEYFLAALGVKLIRSNQNFSYTLSQGFVKPDIFGLTLVRGGSSASGGGTGSAVGGFGGSTGLIVSYYFRYIFSDQVPLTGSAIKTICSSSD